MDAFLTGAHLPPMLSDMSDAPKDSVQHKSDAAPEGESQVFHAATAMYSMPKTEPQAAPEAPAEVAPTAEAGGLVWHVVIGASQQGPMTAHDIASKVASQELTPQALVWRAGMPNWSALNEVAELAAIAAAPDLTVPSQSPAVSAAPADDLGPAAAKALESLMAADLEPVETSQAPAAEQETVTSTFAAQAHPAPTLAGQDLFGSGETQFLQVPGAAAAPSEASAPNAAQIASAAPPAQEAAHPQPRKKVALYLGLGLGVIALAAAAGVYLARPAARAEVVPAQMLPASGAAAPRAPAEPGPSAPAPAPALAAPAQAPKHSAPKTEAMAEQHPPARAPNRPGHGRGSKSSHHRGHKERQTHRRAP